MNVQCAKTSCLESLYIIRSTRVTAIEFSICRLVRECKNTDVNDNGCQLRTVPLDWSAITMLNANCISLTATLRRQVWSKLTLSHNAFHHFPRTEKNYEYHQKAVFEPRTLDTEQELCTRSHDDLESLFTRTIESLFFRNNDSPSVELTSSSSSSSTAEDYNAYRFRFVREVRIIYVPVLISIRHPVEIFGGSLSMGVRRTKLEDVNV
jgi:hypothetical protein